MGLFAGAERAVCVWSLHSLTIQVWVRALPCPLLPCPLYAARDIIDAARRTLPAGGLRGLVRVRVRVGVRIRVIS